MKIELKYDGKNYYDPIFIFFWNNEKDNFKIGIKFSKIIDYTFMREDLLNHYERLSVIKYYKFVYNRDININNVYIKKENASNIIKTINLYKNNVFIKGIIIWIRKFIMIIY